MGKTLSTFAIAQMLHVDPGSVANWIDQGLLKAYRTPGRHRRVQSDDLIHFCREHGMPVPPELQAPPCRVLVIDSDQSATQSLTRTIKASHPEFEIFQANDPFHAGHLIATLAPEIILLDLRMDGINGPDACRFITSSDRTRHANVIALVDSPANGETERICQCGARTCLCKPVDAAVLLKEMENCL